MSSEKALRRKVIVNALCTFFTGKPFDPPLESNDFYFRYNFNKLVFCFFCFSFLSCSPEHIKSNKQKEVRYG